MHSSPQEQIARRTFFGRLGMGLAPVALSALTNTESQASSPPPPQLAHHMPKAKSVIFLNMVGAPPQLDMFDYKPKLEEMDGQIVPPSYTKGQRFAFIKGDAKLLGPRFKFKKYGQSGLSLSDAVSPWMSEIADDICLVRSATTTQFNHSPAALLMFTGFERSGRPSMGAWVNYGLGSESKDLPGFVLLASGRGSRCGTDCFGSGFLPGKYQGIEFLSNGPPVMYLNNPSGIDQKTRRKQLDAIQALNQNEFNHTFDSEILTRIAQYEQSYRMQMAVPELADMSSEPKHIQEMYDIKPGQRHFGNNCLLARRLVERGVRFVQLNHGEWDLHGSRLTITKDCPRLSGETFPGVVALIKDLKQRGLLDQTLVVWGAEFGRTPMMQLRKETKGNIKLAGRDHHKVFSFWMAGGGVKAGHVHGATDDIGYRVVENEVTVHDIQATIMHQLGINHEKLTYRYQGRDFRLTDIHGHVVKDLLA